MSGIDVDWNEMLEIAKLQQQEYYELLVKWTKYCKHEYKYLKQNIGFAIFGAPTESKESIMVLNNKNEMKTSSDVTNIFHYTPVAQKTIDIVYNQVCKFGEGCIESKSIYYGVIYNITFRTKNTSVEVPNNSNNEKVEVKDKEDKIKLYPTPIFKIGRSVTENADEIWYIDVRGRVYKTWTDYKASNTLPQCTMVLPKNGFYQPDPSDNITEEYSIVWLEVLESPACDTAATILGYADVASNIVGVVGLGLCVASVFTPAAPIVIGAAVSSGVTGVWSIGRSTQNLIDRSVHEESLTDRDALCSWLSITGSTIGLAASGGSAVLTKLIKSGNNVNMVTKVAYNTLLLSNLGINGFGIAYQAYCMYERYQENQEIRVMDIVFLGTHILFFSSSVVNLQFAGDLIESTQGRILNDYRSSLRSKNLRKQFNRAKRNAAVNNVDKVSENAEVIRYINRKVELQLQQNASNISLQKSSVFFDKGKMIIGGIKLLDPMKFVDILINSDQTSSCKSNFKENKSSSSDNSDSENMLHKLKAMLLTLLQDLLSDKANENIHVSNTADFDKFFEEIKCMNNATDIFVLIFNMSVALIKHCPDYSEYLTNAVHFIWRYAKESLRQTCLSTFSINDARMQRILSQIVTALFEHIDRMMYQLSPAFEKYMLMYLDWMFH